MIIHTTCMERAVELARSGTVADVAELGRKLNAEGYDANPIYGRGLSVQLRHIMRAGRLRRSASGAHP
jgi:hypothetical protein